jgi:hypothetical protein
MGAWVSLIWLWIGTGGISSQNITLDEIKRNKMGRHVMYKGHKRGLRAFGGQS